MPSRRCRRSRSTSTSGPSDTAAQVRTVTVLADATVTLDIALSPSETYVVGEVRDATTTEPIVGATVSTSTGADDHDRRVRSLSGRPARRDVHRHGSRRRIRRRQRPVRDQRRQLRDARLLAGSHAWRRDGPRRSPRWPTRRRSPTARRRTTATTRSSGSAPAATRSTRATSGSAWPAWRVGP